MVTLNSLDKRLINLLQDNAEQSSDMLAKQLNISSASLRRRKRKLIKNGVISIVTMVDPEKVGLPVASLIALDIAPEKLDSVVQEFSNQQEIIWIATTTGRFDVIALGLFASTENLYAFLKREIPRLEGVKDSETFICMHLESKGKHLII